MSLKLRFKLLSLGGDNKDLIKMFTSKAPMEYKTNTGKKSRIPIKLDFNLKDIPISPVVSALDDVKKNPDATLPQILEFSRPVSRDYFAFISETWSNRGTRDPYYTWNSVSRHMLRSLVCAAHQLEGALPILAQHKDSEAVPYAFIECLPEFAFMSVKMKKKGLFLNWYLKVMNTIRAMLEGLLSGDTSMEFNMDMLRMVEAVCVIMEENSFSPDVVRQMVDFAVAVLKGMTSKGSLQYVTVGMAKVVALIKKHEVIDAFSDDSLNEVVSLFCVFVKKAADVRQRASLETWNNLMSQYLEALSSNSKRITGAKVQADLGGALILFVKWVISQKISAVPLPAAQASQSGTYGSSYDMKSMDTVLKKVMDPIQLGLGDLKGPINVKQNAVTTALGPSYQYILSLLDENPMIFIQVTTGLGVMLKLTSDPSMQLFLVSILVQASSTNAQQALEKANLPPGLLVNEYSMSDRAIKSKEGTIYCDLHAMTQLFICHLFLDGGQPQICNNFLKELSKFLVPDSPTQVYDIVTSLRNAYVTGKKICPAVLGSHPIMSDLIDVDLKYKQKMLTAQTSDALLPKIRCDFVHMLTLLSESKEFCTEFFAKDKNIAYIRHLLFEEGAKKATVDIFSYAIRLCPSEAILIGLKELFMQIPTVESSIGIVCSMLGLLKRAFNERIDYCVNNFVHCEVLASISAMCVKFAAEKSVAGSLDQLLMQTLTTFFAFCRNGHDCIGHFCAPQYHIREDFTKLFNDIPVQEKHLNMWASLAVNNETTLQKSEKQTIANLVALQLLFSLGEKSSCVTSVYAFMEGLIAKSVENRWHCYNSGFLLNLIENTREDCPHKYFKLIHMIGADFCGTKELDAILQILMNTKGQPSISGKLLETCVGMVRNKGMYDFSTGISVENDSTSYYTPSFQKLPEFKLSFSVRLNKIQQMPLFVISTPHEEICVCAGSSPTISYIRRPEFTKEVILTHTKKMNPDKWHTIVFSYSASLMTLQVGQTLAEFKLDEPFKLTGSPVVFDMVCRATPDVRMESIFVTDIPPDTLIHSLSVPQPIGFCDVMPIAGGTKCLLPFLGHVGESSNPSIFFYNLLELIGLVMPHDQSVDKIFIRALSHLLRSIKQDYWEEITVALIGSIAARITNDQLHQCFASNLLLDFGFWVKYPISVHNVAFVKNVVEAYNGNKELFKKSISFGELITRYFLVADAFNNSASVRNGIFAFLLKFAKESLTEEDAFLLLGFFMQTKNFVFAEEVGRIIYALLYSRNPVMSSVIERNGGYMCLIKLIGINCVPVVLWVLNIIFVILKNNAVQNDKDTFQGSVLTMLPVFARRITPESVLPVVTAFIFDSIQTEDGRTPVPTPWTEQAKPLKYSAFIPLLIFLLTSYGVQDAQSYIRSLFSSIQLLEQSRVAVLQLRHWYFWLFYLGIKHNVMADVVKNMGLIASERAKKERGNFKFGIYYSFFLHTASFYNFEWDKHMASFLTAVLGEKSTSSLLVKYLILFLCFKIEFPEARRTGADLDVMTFFADMFLTQSSSARIKLTVREDHHSLDARTGLIFLQTVANAILSDPSTIMDVTKIGDFDLDRVDVIAFVLDFLAEMDSTICEQTVSDLLTALAKKGEFRASTKRSLFYILGIKALPDNSRAAITQYLREKAVAIENDDSIEKTRQGVRKFLETVSVELSEQLSVKEEGLNELATWLEQMLHPEAVSDLAPKAGVEMTQTVDARKANDELNVKQNEKAWPSLFATLTESGGIWSKRTIPEHWEISSRTDAEGRKCLLKENRHFNDHLDASKKRDAEKMSRPARAKTICVQSRKMADNETASFDRKAQLITVKCTYHGTLQVFNRSLAFESQEASTIMNAQLEKVYKLEEIDLSEIIFILKRRYLHDDNGCELFTKSRKSFFFVFSENDRNWFLKEIARRYPSLYIQNDSPAKVLKDFDIVRLWQHGRLSNYEYLYWLNIIGGRSFHDLSQYPVYPWVLSQYTEPTLDLSDQNSYRDLSKPIGTLNPQRLEEMKTLYDELEGDNYRCHYRVFYTSSATVVNYLIRCEPFTTCHIALQSGAFDIATRIVSSIPDTWKSVTSVRPDFRELIPEFFTLTKMFVNENHFDLGLKDNGDMELPPWAPNAEAFVFLHRCALESIFVTQDLHEWVDLMFGYKSRGKAAIDAINDFHPFSYSECLANKAKYEDRADMISEHAATFGVAPQQIFTEPSPKKLGRRGSTSGVDTQAMTNFTFAQGKVARIFARTTKGLLLLAQNELYIASPKDKEMKLVQKLDIKERYLAYFSANSSMQDIPDADMVVAVAPWSSHFVLFGIGAKVKEIASGARHPGIVRAFSVDSYTEIPSQDIVISVGTVSKDLSFFIWQARIRGGKCCDVKMCSSMEHKVPIIDIAVSVNMGLVATIDESPQLVLTRISGQFCRSLKLDFVPYKVAMTRYGYIILFSKDPSNSLHIHLYNPECKLLCTRQFEGEAISTLVHGTNIGTDHIVLAFQHKELALVRLYELTTMKTIKLPATPTSIYSENCQSLWVCYDDGSLSQIRI